MKYQIRKVDEERSLVQITTVDERWYTDDQEKFYPSSSWIAGFYPKGVQFYKWLANTGWNEAEAIKTAAGSRGSKVHNAIADLIEGKELNITDKYHNGDQEFDEELTPEEWWAIMSFVSWYEEVKPKIIVSERAGINTKIGYGGTVDLVCEIAGQVYVVDFKTSAAIWKEYELQVSSYRELLPYIPGCEDVDPKTAKLAILQVGYKLNKRGYKFTELEDKFDLFLHAKAIWQEEINDKNPKQKDYPLKLSLTK